jgi:hypothetical protein
MKKKPKEKKEVQLTAQGVNYVDEIILDERASIIKPSNPKNNILNDMIDIASSIGEILKSDRQTRREPNYELLNAYTNLTNQILNYRKAS